MPDSIPFNRPCFQGKELVYIARAIDNGHISGDGEFTKLCSEFFESELGLAKALLTPSCTHALEMAALLLELEPGDEVIMPSFTFVSTVNAFVLRRIVPVYIDIRPDTLNMDEALLEGLITPKTRAIVPVHYAGVGCEMDSIMEIANRKSIAVVEDNAHGLFGKYKGKYLGTFGAMATQSFHETKNITCGEGGALFLNDESYAHRAEIIREKGTNRSSFFRGEVDKYTWVDVGSSYLPSDLTAGFLWAQIEFYERIQSVRKRIWEYYNEHLQEWAASKGVMLPTVPEYCDQAYHMFYMVMPTVEDRVNLIRDLKSQGIHAVFHYLPLHESEMGQKLSPNAAECPRTVDICERLVRLPFYNDITEEQLDRVVQAVIAL